MERDTSPYTKRIDAKRVFLFNMKNEQLEISKAQRTRTIFQCLYFATLNVRNMRQIVCTHFDVDVDFIPCESFVHSIQYIYLCIPLHQLFPHFCSPTLFSHSIFLFYSLLVLFCVFFSLFCFCFCFSLWCLVVDKVSLVRESCFIFNPE